MDTPNADAVDRTIRDRRTLKVMADAPAPARDRRAVVDELLAVAGWAPFHRPASDAHRGALSSPVPWRFYALDAAACRALRESLGGEGGKVLEMLAAADALVQATWLPDPPSEAAAPGLFEPTVPNMEHIAAAGAAVQNLLLAATARGIPTFWSSGGGVLRTPAVAARLGVPAGEVLLGSVFLFPAPEEGADVVVSKLRETRGEASDWSRWVDLG
jgi:nitroreductase